MNALGISSLSFTIIAVVYILIGTAGAFIVGTADANGHFYFSKQVDELIFQKQRSEVSRDTPEFGKYITRMMMIFCSFLIGMGILQFALARFIPEANHWAYWSSILGNAVMLSIYWFVIILPVMREFNVSYFSLWHPYAFIPTLLLPVGIVSGAIGLYAK